MGSNIFREIDAGAFKDFLPDGAKLTVQPSLPTVEFEKGGIKYEVTDVRLLHPAGIQAIQLVLSQLASIEGETECSLLISGKDEGIADIVRAVVMGFNVTARTDKWEIEARLTEHSTGMTDADGNYHLTFSVQKEIADGIYNYVCGKGGKTVSILDVAVAMADAKREYWRNIDVKPIHIIDYVPYPPNGKMTKTKKKKRG